MPKYEIVIATNKIKVETLGNRKPPLFVFGPAVVDGSPLLQNKQITQNFDVIIPHGPFEKVLNFPIDYFKTFCDWVTFYKDLITNLGKLNSNYKNPLIYAHSSFGLIAALLARDYPELICGAILANPVLYNWLLTQKQVESYSDRNFNIASCYEELFKRDCTIQEKNYFKSIPTNWRWLAAQKQQQDLDKLQNPSFEQTYACWSNKVWYNKQLAQNIKNIALKFWTNKTELNTNLVNSFFTLLIQDKPDALKDLQQNKINIPIFIGYGLYDGLIPVLKTEDIRILPVNCTIYLFAEAAHWITEDPKFTEVILKWHKAKIVNTQIK